MTRSHLLAAALGVLLGVVLSLFVVAGAASRSAHPGVPLVSSAVRAGQSGTPLPESKGAEGSQPGVSVTESGAPTPTATVDGPPAPSALLRGIASWYDDGPGIYAAAGPGLRTGNWRGTVVIVTADGFSVRVQLVDHCYCRVGGATRLIDLSPRLFIRVCGPLSKGLCRVTVAVLE